MANSRAKSKSKSRTKPGIKPGCTTSRSLAAAVQRALQRAVGDGPPDASASKLDLVADALVTKACAGDVAAIKAVFERIDGKVAAEQADDMPQEIEIIHTFKSAI